MDIMRIEAYDFNTNATSTIDIDLSKAKIDDSLTNEKITVIRDVIDNDNKWYEITLFVSPVTPDNGIITVNTDYGHYHYIMKNFPVDRPPVFREYKVKNCIIDEILRVVK